ncbi:MAG: RNA-protein complex protein Nop10 [Thaumarchaeota archaeon]|nr:RNA-protein complex protein Nop10 [Nitrososphaerota archaeon]
MKLLRKCPKCNIYTLRTECRNCAGRTVTAHPPKFSPDDRYSSYRIAARYKQQHKQSSESYAEGSPTT